MKKMLAALALAAVSVCAWTLDIKYAGIVNAAIADLKTHTSLSLLRGHVAIHVTSGSKELDEQFAQEIQKAYPNFASRADTVNNEDLYQMTIKVYRENAEAVTLITLTDFQGRKIAERTVTTKNVSAAVIETLQYKTAFIAKNEFDEYLNSAFANTGEIVADARQPPPKPAPPPVDWSPLSDVVVPTFSSDMTFGFGIGTNIVFNLVTLLVIYDVIMPFYSEVSFGSEIFEHTAWLDENWEYGGSYSYSSSNGRELVDYETTPLRVKFGVILPYNKYLLFPIGIGTELNMYWNDSSHIRDRIEDEYGTSMKFVFSAGVMIKIKSVFLMGSYTFGKYEIDNHFEFILGLGL